MRTSLTGARCTEPRCLFVQYILGKCDRLMRQAVVAASRLLALRDSQQVAVRCDEVLQEDLLLLPEHVHMRNSPRLLQVNRDVTSSSADGF